MPYVIRTEKRHAIDAAGEPAFQPRITKLVAIPWKPEHAAQKQLYEAVKGKVTERTLTTTLKKEAIFQANQLSAQLTNKKMGVADDSAPINQLFDEYFRAIQGRNASETLKRLASSRHMFERWIEQTHPELKLVRHITPGVVREFQEYRVGQGVAKRTADNDISNLHTVFKWGEREVLVSKSPFDYSKHGTVQLYDEPEPEPDTYTEEEYRQLVEAANNHGDTLIRDMIIVFADTGLRFGELANLCLESLHWETTPPHVDIRARNGWKPKDPDEVKLIPMSDSVVKVLKRRETEANGGLLFTNGAGNRIAENHTRDRLKGFFSGIGISPDRRLHWHSWRNHFVVRCLDAGIFPHQVMEWTGHDSVSMVLHYAKVRSKDRTGSIAFREFPPRGTIGETENGKP